jgi:endonuclease G, mitochondrial
MSITLEERKLLCDRVRLSFKDRTLSDVFKNQKAIIGPQHLPLTDEGKLAEDTLRALENGEFADPRGLAALELMIKLTRPSMLVLSGNLEALDSQTGQEFPEWTSFQSNVRSFLDSIGRINDADGSGVGTGFLVRENLIATNAHVVAVLSRGTMLLQRGQATIEFTKEHGRFEVQKVDIISVLAFDDAQDLALLALADGVAGRPPLSWSESVSLDPNASVVAIGYPFDDPVRNPLFIPALFRGIFGVKRAAPGRVVSLKGTLLSHDCSTLGGNSGSPVFAMASGKLVGVHREGMFMYLNKAVRAEVLQRMCHGC